MKMYKLPFRKQLKHLTFHRMFWKAYSATAWSQMGGSLIFWRKKARGVGLHTQILSSKSMTIVTHGVFMKSLLVMKHGFLAVNVREKVQNRAWVPKGGNPPHIANKKSISEEGAVQDIRQLKRNRAKKVREVEKSIGGKYYRVCTCWGQLPGLCWDFPCYICVWPVLADLRDLGIVLHMRGVLIRPCTRKYLRAERSVRLSLNVICFLEHRFVVWTYSRQVTHLER